MKKQVIFLSIIFISFSINAQNSNLNTLINGIINNSSSIKSQKTLLKMGEIKTSIQESFAKPVIGADLGVTRIDPVAKANFNGTSLQFQPNMNYTIGFSANHVIYDWGKNAIAIEKTRLENALTQTQIESQEANLAYQIAQLYYQYQLLLKTLNVQKNQQKRLEDQLEIIKNQVQNGTNLTYDEISQKVRIQNQAVRITEIDAQLKDINDYLSTLFGSDATGLLKEQPLSPDKKYITGQNISNNLDLQTLSAQELLAQKETVINKGGNLPSISGIASLGVRNGYVPRLNGDTPAFSDDFKLNSVLGFKLNIPIYTGKRTALQTQLSKLNEERIHLQKIDAENRLSYAERSARNNLITSIQRIEAQEKVIDQAEYALKLASERYRLGLIKKIELDQAESILEEAQLNLVQFNYQAKKQEFDLRKVIGETFWK